jgi:hypothetical protein
MRLRGKTAEPVVGTLLNFGESKKNYTKGNDLTSKQVLIDAVAYSLKKFMCFKTIKIAANIMKNTVADLKTTVSNQIVRFLECILCGLTNRTKKNEYEFLL